MRAAWTGVGSFVFGMVLSVACTGGSEAGEDGDCPVGSAGCRCTVGAVCDAGLVCFQEFCVPPGEGTSGASNADGNDGNDTTPPATGEPSTGPDPVTSGPSDGTATDTGPSATDTGPVGSTSGSTGPGSTDGGTTMGGSTGTTGGM